MRIVFVRHGHPDYAKDCLTEKGHIQAEAVAVRLMDESITEIYSSSCGRAIETAQHTARHFGLPVIPMDFIREISWGSVDGEPLPHGGHPWRTAEHMVQSGADLMRTDWQEEYPFCSNRVVSSVAQVAKDLDDWLDSLGYSREGAYYRVTGGNTNRTIGVFCHAGAFSAAAAHLLNIPFPLFCATIAPDFTAVTVLQLSNTPGMLITPKVEICNDSRHIQGEGIVISR